MSTVMVMTSFEYKAVGRQVAAAGVRNLRRAAAGDEVSKTALADRLGMRRQTLATHFSRGDMKLSEFTSAALSLGRRPSDLLAEIDGSVSFPALAGKGVE